MTTTQWETLPDPVKTFMTALDSQEVDRALATLTADAVVTDRLRVGLDLLGALMGVVGGRARRD